MARRIALALHGAGSDGAFAGRCFRADDLAVDSVVTVEHRDRGTHSLLTAITRQIEAARSRGEAVALLAGVSLGAHAAAIWAARARDLAGLEGLLLVMPAWTGRPAHVAAATEAAAREVTELGSAAIIERLRAESPHDWVVGAMAESWPRYGDRLLAASLLSASGCAGPTAAELVAIPLPCAIVALDDDPLHPRAVAVRWHELIARSALGVLPRDLGGGHTEAAPSTLGRAAMAALGSLSGSR